MSATLTLEDGPGGRGLKVVVEFPSSDAAVAPVRRLDEIAA
jgi:hypothetical protein